MSRTTCRFLSPMTPGRGRVCDCSHPEVGGEVQRAKECVTCEKWEARPGAPLQQLTLRVRRETQPPPTPPVPPCAFVGDPSPPPNGLPSSKTFYVCDAGLGVVCACQCGPKCAKYKSEEDE